MKARLQRMHRPIDKTKSATSFKDKIAEYKHRHPEKAQLKRPSNPQNPLDPYTYGDGLEGKLRMHNSIGRRTVARHYNDIVPTTPVDNQRLMRGTSAGSSRVRRGRLPKIS